MLPFPIISNTNILPEPEPFNRPVQAQYSNMMVLIGDSLYGMGNNNYGQLGIGNTAQTSLVLCKTNVRKYFLGTNGTIVVSTDNKIHWSGRNTAFPQAGTRTSWYDVTDLMSAVGVSATNIKDCQIGESLRVLTSGGNFIYCGRNYYGECGVTSGAVNNLTVHPFGSIKTLRGSINSTNFILSSGDAYFCGLNSYGESGLNHKNKIETPTYVTSDVLEISTALYGTQWFKTNGTVYYSGYGTYGTLAVTGSNDSVQVITLNSTIPQINTQYPVIVTTDLGNSTGVGPMLMSNNSIRHSGVNTFGNIGRGDIGGTTQLGLYTLDITSMGGYSNVAGIDKSAYGTYILTKDNKLYACGGSTSVSNGYGLPDGSFNQSTMKLMVGMPWE